MSGSYTARSPWKVYTGLFGIIFGFGIAWPLVVLLRRLLCLPLEWEHKCTRLCANFVSACLELNVRVINSEIYNPREAAIVIANHSSLIDIPAVYMAASERLRMMGKKSLFMIPIFGWGMWAGHHVSVNRNNKAASARARVRLASRLNQGYQIFLAPEGTRSANGCLLPFKSGAFRIASENQVPIYVLGLFKPWEILPKGKIIPRIKGEIQANFLGKIEPLCSGKRAKSPEELLAEARGLFLSHGFEEC